MAAGLAMAFKLVEAAQARWRAVNALHLVAPVRAGAAFKNGKLVERPGRATRAQDEAAQLGPVAIERYLCSTPRPLRPLMGARWSPRTAVRRPTTDTKVAPWRSVV